MDEVVASQWRNAAPEIQREEARCRVEAPNTPADGTVWIRQYNQGDRTSIRRLCCDTGFFGNPVDTVFKDRELFADLFTRPYLEYEREWAMVAESDGRVIGYLLGSVRKRFELLLLYAGFQTTVKMLLRLASGRYGGHARSKQFIGWLLTRGYREQPRHPAESAHLHLDLERAFRGRGIGRRLWEAYRNRLEAAGIKRCYGAFFSRAGRRPEMIYARYGFTVFDRRRTTVFSPEVSGVEVVCVHREL